MSSLVFLIAPLLLVVSTVCHTATGAAFPPMWPVPQYYTNGTAQYTVSSNLVLHTSCQSSSDLSNSFARFLQTTFEVHNFSSTNNNNNDNSVSAMLTRMMEKKKLQGTRRLFNNNNNNNNNTKDLTSVQICLKDNNVPLKPNVDESYTLSVATDKSISITCPTVYGCYHALETLSQLITYSMDHNTYLIQSIPWEIKDAPRFPHRGLLIDSSRHFLPLSHIKKVIDSLGYVKLNVLHWHIVDWQAWPYDDPTYPGLAQKGAWSAQERYTWDDMLSIVEYARARGVRVMPELDTPGHSAAMCDSLPEICPTPLCSNGRGDWTLDFTKERTFEVMGNLISNFRKLFPETFFHIGGDEVNTACWKSRPYIMKWLQEHNMTVEGGEMYYVNRIIKDVRSKQFEAVGWQELWQNFGTSLPKGTVIQQWYPDSSLPAAVTSQGYYLLWSVSNTWYLDWLDTPWDKMYNADPCTGLTEKQCGSVLGGEACMWGETVDASDAFQTIFPRLAAVAERLWSPVKQSTMNDNTLDRMLAFRCLLNDRGIEAAPVHNKHARSAPPHPGSCFLQ